MKRPNILILYTDQQRFDALGAAGNDEIHTPNLDRLAADGLHYTHCFVQNPVCMPSRLSFLTGRYAGEFGVYSNGVPVPADTLTLPRMLGNFGYTSANIGKLHFLPHANRDHREVHPSYGFDHLEISDEPGCYEDAYRAWVRRIAPEELGNISLGLPPATKVWREQLGVRDGIRHRSPEGGRHTKRAEAFAGRSDLTHTAFVAAQTMEFLRSRGGDGGPFFCIAGFYSPHSPWIAPREFLDLYEPAKLSLPGLPPKLDAQRRDGHFSDDELRSAKHGYYAMVSEVDHHVGRILGCLDERGLADDTIVVFTSDHGEWLGEHLRYGKGGPGDDAIARVPLLVRHPGAIASPGRVDDIVEALDVAPTLLQCAGVPAPPVLQGRTLPGLGELAGGARGSALLEMPAARTVRTKQFRYTLRADGSEELFDVQADPGQYHDVSGDTEHSAALAGMRKELARRLIEMERSAKQTWAY